MPVPKHWLLGWFHRELKLAEKNPIFNYFWYFILLFTDEYLYKQKWNMDLKNVNNNM